MTSEFLLLYELIIFSPSLIVMEKMWLFMWSKNFYYYYPRTRL